MRECSVDASFPIGERRQLGPRWRIMARWPASEQFRGMALADVIDVAVRGIFFGSGRKGASNKGEDLDVSESSGEGTW